MPTQTRVLECLHFACLCYQSEYGGEVLVMLIKCSEEVLAAKAIYAFSLPVSFYIFLSVLHLQSLQVSCFVIGMMCAFKMRLMHERQIVH